MPFARVLRTALASAFVLGASTSFPAASAANEGAGAPANPSAGGASAGSAPSAPVDPDVSRLNAAGHSLKWNWVPPGRGERYGHAEVLINAPIDKVRAHVLDFAKYKDIAPAKFKKSRIVAKSGSDTDVYMQVPIMNGMVTLWSQARFSAPKVVGPGVEVVEGRNVKGNVKDLHAIWTMRKLSEDFTLLKFDLLLLPNVPAPQAAIDEELRDAAMQAVDAIHDRAQGHPGSVPFGVVAAKPQN
jgi:ribosome-associated toxin RatA of RatAB toxin-antitoxin module